MKRVVLSLVFVVASVLASAQIVEKTFYFNEPGIVKSGEYQLIEFDDCLQSAVAGQPILPWQKVSLMLPAGMQAESVEVLASDYRDLSGIFNLYPYQSSRTYSDTSLSIFQKDLSIYTSKEVYPVSNKGVLTTQYMNGFAFAFSTFTPVKYVPASGQITYASQVTVRVKLTENANFNPSMLKCTPDILRRVKALAQNPEMIDTYSQFVSSEIPAYDILVITPQAFVPAFELYKDFYLDRGLRTRVVATDSVYNVMTGVDNAEKLRNFIIQQYTQNGIGMVLLGGDVSKVPYRGFYCFVESSTDQTDNGIPADLYFAALDGTWNNNNNNSWGEIGEDDLLPEIGIARMTFDDLNELNNMLHKTMTYQATPVLGEFNKVVLAGEHLYDNPESNGSDYLELLIGTRTNNGYTTVGIPSDYTFTKLYEQLGTWSGTALRNAINAGQQFVHHDGHANYTYVAGWSNQTISDVNFAGADGENHNYTFFHTSGCMCGGFDQEDCIMERMVSISNFAVCAIGNSRFGWFNEGQTEGPSIHLHREMVDAFFNDRIPYIGLALTESKIQTAPWVNAPGQWEEGALRWNFYDLNIMGDVAVCPWNDEPITPLVTYYPTIVNGDTLTSVTVMYEGQPLKQFRCNVMKNGQLIGFGITDETGVAQVRFSPALQQTDSVQLIVTGPDAFPQQYTMQVISNNLCHVVLDNFAINDSMFNNNGLADYSESFSIDVTLKNLGIVTGTNISATVTGSDPYVTCTQSQMNAVASIQGNTETEVPAAFNFTVADSVPDSYAANFVLSVTDGNEIWTSPLRLMLQAPIISMEGLFFGQGMVSSVLEVGETGLMRVVVKNDGHSDMDSLKVSIAFADTLLTADTYSKYIDVPAKSTMACEFQVTVDQVYDAGMPTMMFVDLQGGVSDIYTYHYDEEIMIGHTADIRMSNGTFTTCNANFYDSRGALNNYLNNENKTLTFKPSHSDCFSRVVFSNFHAVDTLYVYDGLSVEDPLILKLIGYTTPEEIVATNPDGALTFHFESDGSATAPGWVAVVDCYYPEPFTVDAYASPVYINIGDSSVLTAVVSGGLEPYTYSWTPTETLSDPTSPNPTSWPTETTTYTVVVTSGDEQLEASVLVTVGGVGLSESKQLVVVMYPNPAREIINISLNNHDAFSYALLNANGQVLTSGTSNGETIIDISKYAKGLYFISINQDGHTCVKKIVLD